jgi:hypothetical protein
MMKKLMVLNGQRFVEVIAEIDIVGFLIVATACCQLKLAANEH